MHGGGGQWIRSRGFQAFCALAPVLVTADPGAAATSVEAPMIRSSHSGCTLLSILLLLTGIPIGEFRLNGGLRACFPAPVDSGADRYSQQGEQTDRP